MFQIIVFLVLLLLAFVVGRALVLWYWRVNAIIERLDAIAIAINQRQNQVQQVEMVVRQ